jgi:hypothetical protein
MIPAAIGAGAGLSFWGGRADAAQQRSQFSTQQRLNAEQFGQSHQLARDQYDTSKKFAWKHLQHARGQFKEQQHLARHGISMRVKDAKAAGIHPLAAMGLPTTGGAPVSVGGGAQLSGNSPMPQGFGSLPHPTLGQDLGSLMNSVTEIVKALAKTEKPTQQPDAPGSQLGGDMTHYRLEKTGNSLQLLPSRESQELVSESTKFQAIFLKNAMQSFGKTGSPEAKRWLIQKVRSHYPNATGYWVGPTGRVEPRFGKAKALYVPVGKPKVHKPTQDDD